MGQASSVENSIPGKVEDFQGDIYRHVRVLSEIATLSYDDLKSCLWKLNALSKQCVDSSGNQLVFAIKKGTDSTVLWKGKVKIACVKVNPTTHHIESYRLLTLAEFLKVFRSMEGQLNAAGKSTHNEQDQMESLSSSSTIFSADRLLEQMNFVPETSGKTQEQIGDCCICLERKPEVILPCTHSYCLPCIEQWNVNHKTCPICCEKLESTDDTWVISEAPGSQEISESICSSLMNLAGTSSDDR